MIRTYINRYLEGESTQEELRLLREYFRSTPDLPPDLVPFARMFALLDEKQPTPSAEALDSLAGGPSPDLSLVGRGADTNGCAYRSNSNHSSPCKGEVGRGSGAGRGLGLLFLAAACLAAIAFILLTPTAEEESLAVAYVDGKMLRDEQAAMQMGRDALQEIFSMGNQEEQLTQIFNAP